jgi:thymidylate synthase (FAD)
MLVKLVAATELMDWPDEYEPHTITKFGGVAVPCECGADELAEISGRLCYESWDRPNPTTASNHGYLGNIISQRHFSVLEHSSASFYIEGVSRSLLAELSRHRHLSFSVLSQRYVDHSESNVVVPPVAKGNFNFLIDLEAHNRKAVELYAEYVEEFISHGMTRKEARGAARAFLPEATETKMIVTGNMRAWREVIEKRNSPAADQEIRELAEQLLAMLRSVAPNTFQDM